MLDNTITLAVNEDNDDGTTPAVDHDFENRERFANRSVYLGPLHTPASADLLSIYRTFPKENGNYRGTAKSAVKFSKEIVVPGKDTTTEITSPQILEISFSNPVGSTVEQQRMLRYRAAAMLMSDDLMDDICFVQMV